MARRRPFVLVASVALVLAAVGAALLSRGSGGPPAAPRPSADGAADVAADPVAGPAPFAFRWPAGTVYTYGVALDATGRMAQTGPGAGGGAAPLSASLALEGELVLRSYGRLPEGGDWVLGVGLTRIDRLDWTFAGEPVLADGRRSLAGRELALVVAPDGTFRSLAVASDDPDALQLLLRQVLAPLEAVVSSGEGSWTTRQTNLVGDVELAWEVDADEPDRLSLRRRPVRYTRLAAEVVLGDAAAAVTGGHAVVLDRAGHLEQLAGAETVTATRTGGEVLRQETRVEARLRSVTRVEGGPGAAERLAGLEATGLGDVRPSPDAGRRLLAQRAGGLTAERLIEDLYVHAPAPEIPDAARWMWQATGLLRLHPERCRDLVSVLRSPRLNDRARARVLDLLAATGTPEAQAVLRELLETPEARGSDRHDLMLQRLSLVTDPTPETVDWLRERVGQAEGDTRLAAAHALGAAVGERARAEGGAVDERGSALLREGLVGAATTRETVGWLGARGNAGLPEDVPLIVGYATDEDPAVRAAAANALRKVQTPAAEAALLGLAADSDGQVQSRALHTLMDYALTPAHLGALRQDVLAGRIGPDAFPELTSLLEANRHQPEAVLPVLDAVLEQAPTGRRLLLRDCRSRAATSGRGEGRREGRSVAPAAPPPADAGAALRAAGARARSDAAHSRTGQHARGRRRRRRRLGARTPDRSRDRRLGRHRVP